MSALLSTEPVRQNCATGHIDDISHEDIDGLKEFCIRGWALEAPGKRRLKAVALLRDGNLAVAASKLATREDVSRALDTPERESGFIIKAFAHDIEQLRLVAVTMDGRIQHFPVVCGGLRSVDLESDNVMPIDAKGSTKDRPFQTVQDKKRFTVIEMAERKSPVGRIVMLAKKLVH
jgi:hypothetical protein